MILSTLGLPFPHGFVFGNSRATSQWVTHHGSVLATFSLNFGVPTEPEANELTKGIVLEYTFKDHSLRRLHRSTILSALGLNHALTILFLGTHVSRTSQWVTHHGSALATFSLNFGVSTEPEASELPKGLSESSFLFSHLLLPLACITIIFFTNTTTNVPYPLFFYSDLQTSLSSSQPISSPTPTNPVVPGAASQMVQGAGSVASEQGHGEICTLIWYDNAPHPKIGGWGEVGWRGLRVR
ncbi:hypothetical protein DVH24_025112 [Malus domestica]|uniref:Uncharacterized protein n=1 Tax=Malus domestica TaxID=3750 RepID=A0A498HR35_MALDO|nr:hypothetical protein DVH24_025112 [Malus domestica]